MTTIDEARAQHRRQVEWMRLWREHGGGQHGPHTETVTMPLDRFAGFMEAALLSSYDEMKGRIEEAVRLCQDSWGALNFILAFYDPGQNYLDTNAWKQAEATGRRVHAALASFVSREKVDGGARG